MFSWIANHVSLAIPIASTTIVWGGFLFLDENAPLATRLSLSTYIKGEVPKEQFATLPKLVELTLVRVFGLNHWSAKCAGRSILLTAFGLTGLCIFSWAYNPHDFLAFVAWATKLPRQKTLPFIFMVLLWCSASDFFSLFKTRVVLAILGRFDLSIANLFFVAILDFLLGAFVFLGGASVLIAVCATAYAFYSGTYHAGVAATLGADFIISAALFVLSTLLLIFSGALFYAIPFANLFWSSMLPSMWLWAYIGAAIGTRSLLATTLFFPRISRLIDADNHPFKVVGSVAAPVIGLLTLAAILVRSLL